MTSEARCGSAIMCMELRGGPAKHFSMIFRAAWTFSCLWAYQIPKSRRSKDECLYSNKDTLTRALIAYAKRTTMRKRLSPSGR